MFQVESSKGRIRVPSTPPPDVPPLRELEDGWQEYQVENRPFFYNKVTGERGLKPPRKIAPLQVRAKRFYKSPRKMDSSTGMSYLQNQILHKKLI